MQNFIMLVDISSLWWTVSSRRLSRHGSSEDEVRRVWWPFIDPKGASGQIREI